MFRLSGALTLSHLNFLKSSVVATPPQMPCAVSIAKHM
jgi:hypothetical protein